MKRICIPVILILIVPSLFAFAKEDLQTTMNGIAESYVRLVLSAGEIDPDYVDAYFGPPEWRDQAKAKPLSQQQIQDSAAKLTAQLNALQIPASDTDNASRRKSLLKELRAMQVRLNTVAGKKLKFDEESSALYDAVAPTHTEADFKETVTQLAALLPGTGELRDRLDQFKSGFVIPKDKLNAVFQAAIDEARKRTKQHIELPGNENFKLEYVTNKPWSGYNWYQGNAKSLIQINTDFPIYIDRAIDLAAHEGYPGHHVFNVLLEQHLVKEKGWVEFSVYPLFCPRSLIAEGTANFGIDVAFPGQQRIDFETKVLFPLAGLDPKKALLYYQVKDVTDKLAYAGNEAARRYLNGDISADQAAQWLSQYTLTTLDRAKQRVSFMDKYRSYVINYNLGKDLVRHYIEARGGVPDQPAKLWLEFQKLLSSPLLPSDMKE